jgi:hypothetical protein
MGYGITRGVATSTLNYMWIGAKSGLFLGFSVLLIALPMTSCSNSKSSDQGDVEIDKVTKASWTPLDVSDVAFLWPHVQGQRFNQLLSVYVPGREKNLVFSPQTIDGLICFSLSRATNNCQLFNPRTGRHENIDDPTDSWQGLSTSDLRVVSARIDDCGHGLHRGEKTSRIDKWINSAGRSRFLKNQEDKCQVSLRLVAQPARGDNAFHLIYNYPDVTILNKMMLDLQELKKQSPVPTTGEALGVHPGLLAEGGVGPFSQKVMQWILNTADPNHLTELAVISTDQRSQRQWNFFKAEVVERNGKRQWQAVNMDNIDGSPISQGFRVSQNKRNPLPGPPVVTGANDSLSSIAANFDPRRSFTSGTDCKSCHLATQLAVRLVRGGLDSRRLFPNPQDVFDTPGVTSFPDSRVIPGDDRNFRAFGWFQNRPTVSGWLAKKVGGVAQSMNQRFLEQSEGQGAQCTGHQHLVMQCLIENAGRPSQCLQQICTQ